MYSQSERANLAEEASGRHGRLHNLLRKHKLSVTAERDELLSTLVLLAPCHLKDLHNYLQHKMPRNTAYRNVKVFMELGVIELVRAGVIDLKPPFRRHGHQMVCEKCGRQIGFNDERLERLLERLAGSRRFEMGHHRVELYGECDVCRTGLTEKLGLTFS